MTSLDDDIDPFDLGVERNRYGHPLIIQLNAAGEPTGKTKPYIRASTVAKALDSAANMIGWKTRHVAVGIAKSPDLAAMAGAMCANPDTLTAAKKAELDAICEQAHDRSFGNDKANWGTAVHALTEPDNDGTPFNDAMAADVAAFDAEMGRLGLRIIDSEQFCVQDLICVAGTFDHRILTTRNLHDPATGELLVPAGTALMADKKTGTLHLDQCAIQLGIYARSKLYDHRTGARQDMECDLKYALVIHIPKGKAKCVVHLVDIDRGWTVGAYLAMQAREFTASANVRKLSVPFEPRDDEPGAPGALIGPVTIIDPATPDVEEADPAVALLADTLGAQPIEDHILECINKAVAEFEFAALWREFKADWQPHHTERVKERQAEMTAAA